MHRTPLWAILLVVLCTILVATGQILVKLALGEAGILANPLLWTGLALFGIGGLILPFALKHGEISVLHPILALGFVWITLASIYSLHEQIPWTRLTGIAIIIFGVSFIGHGGRK